MQAPISLLHQLSDLNIPSYPSVTGLRQPVSVGSLARFFWALVWGGVLLVSFTGWGRFAGKILRVQRLPASVACTVGIAVIIFLGGLLNLLNAIYALVIFVLVAMGLLLYLLLRKERPEAYRWGIFWRQSSPAARLLVIAMLLILAYRVAGTVRLAHFDVADDSAIYLSLPQKTLSTHHFASDPFSERRNTSSLGGSYLLQDFVLSTTSLSNIAMADRTVGLLLLAAVAFDLGVAFELSVLQIALLLFLAFLVPQQTFNLTFIVLPVPLLLAMVWLLFRAQDENAGIPLQYALLAGIVGGAMISLKSTYLPIVGALSVIPYLASLRRNHVTTVVKLVFSTVVGVLIVLAFWMIAMRLTSGTYLFPILGRGLDYSARGLFPAVVKFSTRRSILKVVIQGAALLVLAVIQLSQKSKTRYSVFSITVLISAALSIIALNYASSADSIWRYNFPQFFVAVVVFYLSAMAMKNQFQQSASTGFARAVAVVAMLLMIFYYDLAGRKPKPFQEIAQEATNWQAIAAGLTSQTLASPELGREYRSAENSIPTNEAMLENAAYSFLLNYRSHNIYLMGWAGASAPAPGWPFGADSNQLSSYLQRDGFHYVLLDSRYMLQSNAIMCQDLQMPERFSEWLKQQLWMNILANLQLDDLMNHYQSIHNDGSMTVLDLTKPAPGSPAEQPAWGIGSSVDAVCSQVAQKYFATQANTPAQPRPNQRRGSVTE